MQNFDSSCRLSFFQTLEKLDMPLYVFKDEIKVKSKGTNAGSDNLVEKLGLVEPNYNRTNFASHLDGRFILMTTWRALGRDIAPKRVIQIDFMHFEDWDGHNDEKKSYISRSDRESMGGKGIFTPSLSFLRKLNLFIRAIDPGCRIQICPSDDQRADIYKRALGDLENVDFYFDADKAK